MTIDLYCEARGKGHPLILITGLGATRLFWSKQVGVFSQRYRVMAVDNRDAGDSPLAAAPYAIADMAGDIAALLERNHLERTHVLGISMGGFIALHLALALPRKVAGLILVSTSPGGPAHVQAGPELDQALMRVEGEDARARMERIIRFLTGPGFTERNPLDARRYIDAFIATEMADEPYERQVGAVMGYAHHGVSDRLGEISVPTLVIHGTEDRVIPFENGHYLARHLQGAQLSTYDGVGHLPPLEAYERFNREVIDFLG